MINDRWNPADADQNGALRALYAAPSDDSYWDALEARILAHVARGADVQVWWAELPQMARPAFVAAAALIIMAGAMMARTRQLEVGSAYATVISAAPVEAAARAAAIDVADVDVAINLGSQR